MSAAAPDAPRLRDYFEPGRLPAPPPARDWGARVAPGEWGRMLNDRLRTCAFSAAGHLVRCWTSRTGHGEAPSDDAILAAYEVVSGYERSGPRSADVGVAECDALEHWRVEGIGESRIDAYASVRPDDAAEVRTAIEVFGGCYVALDLPATAQSQDVWELPDGGAVGRGAPGSWLAHAVALVAYDERTVTAVAWGAPAPMTWNFLAAYGASAFAVVSTEAWFVAGAPAALDLDGLTADLDRRRMTPRPGSRFYRPFTAVP